MARFYAILARLLLPRSFHAEYGAELEHSVEARLAAAAGIGRGVVLVREVVDLLRTSIREWWWEVGVGRSAPNAEVQRRIPNPSNERARPLESVLQDLRYALRQIGRAPGFAAVVILTLGMGIGLNTAVFSGVHALLLRALAGVREPDRLVQIYRVWPGIPYGASSIPHYRDLRDRGVDVFDGVAAWSFVTLSLGSEDETDVAVGQMVSANFFDVLGVRAVIGRTFLPEEVEGIGAHPVVVLSHEGWMTRFDGDRAIVGRTVHVNGVAFEVIGVAPERFRGPVDLYAPVLWAPLSMQPQLQPGRGDRVENRNSNFLSVVARLRPGVSVDIAGARARAVLETLRREHPTVYGGTGIALVPQHESGIGPSYGSTPERLAALLMAVVGLLLLLACANVANLLLSRAEQRRREIGIRLSIGAGRARIARQLLTESVLYATLAGAAGLALAFVAIRALGAIRPPTDLPIDARLELSMPVLLFTVAVALGTAILFGLVPALHASRAASSGGIGSAVSVVRRGSRVTPALVIVQTALAVVLLLTATLFLRSLWTATRIELGFDAARLLTARVHPNLVGHDRASAEQFMRSLAERLAARPDVHGVSWSDVAPLGLSGQNTRVVVPGYLPASGEQMSLDYARVGPGYFETMGIPVLRGRGITASDDSAAVGVVVVNQAMAERYWPGEDPIGRIVEAQGGERVVVGVAANSKYRRLDEGPTAFVYFALAQTYAPAVTVLVRAAGDPAVLVPQLRRTVRDVDPAMPLREIRTMESHLGATLFPSRIAAGALALFGILGVLLSTVGIYGVIAHAVSRQTREIGVRIALGAKPSRVRGLVLARGARLTSLGVGTGLLMAVGAAATVRRLLYTDSVVDPIAFIGVPLLLGAIALVATWIPARRAARIDPVRALKSE